MQRDPLGWMLWEGGHRWRTWTGILSILVILLVGSCYAIDRTQPDGGTGVGGVLFPENLLHLAWGRSAWGFLILLLAAAVPLAACLYAILEGTRSLAGLEKGGTLGVYLASYPNRSRFLLTSYGALVIELLGMGLVVGLILAGGRWFLGYGFPAGQPLEFASFWILAVLLPGTLGFSLGAATGRQGLSRWICAGLVLLIVGWLAIPLWLPQYSFPWNRLLLQATRHPLPALLSTLALLAGGAWMFNQRDLQL